MNIRRINCQEKWDAMRDKINESACHVLCLQEIKRESFNSFYIKKFYHKNLDKFAFSPSVGASGGLLTVWNSNLFDGSVVQANSYAVTVRWFCRLDNKTFFVTNIYGPANSLQKQGFVTWLMNLDYSKFEDRVLGGDFKLIMNPGNVNKPGGDIIEMNMFNELISDLDLVDIPFSGRNYTWSNMQTNPLLVKLDWVFTSSTWTLSFPATFLQPLPRPISDHIPYVLHIGSSIPKSKMLRFENFRVDHLGFLKEVNLHWNSSRFFANAAKNLSTRLN